MMKKRLDLVDMGAGLTAQIKDMVKQAVDRLVSQHYPERVWIKGSNGKWSQREADAVDREMRRAWVIKHYRKLFFDEFQVDLDIVFDM